MLSPVLKVFLALFAFSTFTAAQFGPDQRWTNPNGSFPDFTDSYRQGEVVTLSWTALNNSVSDLWLTNYNATGSNFNVSLASMCQVEFCPRLDTYISYRKCQYFGRGIITMEG